MEDFYYRKLKVYHLAKELVADVYSLAKSFPKTEQYGLTSQLCRAVISIPSNIAEGMGRFSKKERVHFLEVAYGSLMETMCQLEIQNNKLTGATEQEANREADTILSPLTPHLSPPQI